MPIADFAHLIRNVPEFPKPGIQFKDITPMLQHGPALRAAVDDMAAAAEAFDWQVAVGIESRGFLFASALAYATGRGVALVRKPGKLPAAKVRLEYALEYGHDAIEIHADAVAPGQRVLVVDDVLATGGTARAAGDLIGQIGGTVAAYLFLAELGFLAGRARLADAPVVSLLRW